MAIYQRDRNFYQLFSDINIDIIPLKFLKDITCILQDGTTVTMSKSEFRKFASDDDHLENLIKNLSFYNLLTDLKIRIDYDQVEQDVDNAVTRIFEANDQSNPRV